MGLTVQLLINDVEPTYELNFLITERINSQIQFCFYTVYSLPTPTLPQLNLYGVANPVECVGV